MDTPNTMIERRKAWIDAATSGKYTQTRSEFKSKEKDNCFCFTGLACEIYREMTGDGAWVLDVDTDFYVFEIDGIEDDAAAMTSVMRFFGLYDRSGTYCNEDDEVLTSLTLQNDDGASFEKLAEIVLAEPERLLSAKGRGEREDG